MVRTPTPGTLRKYGLTEQVWRKTLTGQGGVCAVCRKEPPSGRLVVDHHHVKGWKRMPPTERVKYVRGLLCFVCNGKRANKYMTVVLARAVVDYLLRYEQRRPK
jgi:hypothetical protein